jgi:hypothetical protein
VHAEREPFLAHRFRHCCANTAAQRRPGFGIIEEFLVPARGQHAP